MHKAPLEPDPLLRRLRELTPARVALGRVGNAPPLKAVLDFQLAHSEARDAVWHAPDWGMLERGLTELGAIPLRLQSHVQSRAQYLLRPDMGRRLHTHSRATLTAHPTRGFDVALVLADGLSAAALEQHTLHLCQIVLPQLERRGLSVAPIALVEHARVAIGDEIAEILKAQTVVVLIGERPGLSVPHSLGVYLTHHPQVGRVDSERNCISNIQLAGLSYPQAAETLLGLLEGARVLGRSGVDLKPVVGGALEGES